MDQYNKYITRNINEFKRFRLKSYKFLEDKSDIHNMTISFYKKEARREKKLILKMIESNPEDDSSGDDMRTENVFFTRTSTCSKKIIKRVNAAQSKILVQEFVYKDKDIAEALINAHNRGIKVIMILDKREKTVSLQRKL